jgi:prepilin-type N-terminal cleavage/methylation domain-containing protein
MCSRIKAARRSWQTNPKSAVKPPHARRGCAGLSLMEMLVAAAIGSLLLTAVAYLSLYSTRSFVALGNYADLDKLSRNALDIMSRDIRQSALLTAYQTNSLTFSNADGTTLIFNYDPSSRQVTRTLAGARSVLLTQCDFLNFDISQRNPSNNFTFYPVSATNASMAKLIDVSWRCSRQILGVKINTESVQTAKIVIRN